MEIQIINAIINEAVKGLDITPEQKSALLGMYFGYLFKSMLEILMGLKSDDPQFYTKINATFLELIDSLSTDDRKDFDNILQKEKTRVLAEVLGQFKDNLEPELKTKVESNIEKMISKLPQTLP